MIIDEWTNYTIKTYEIGACKLRLSIGVGTRGPVSQFSSKFSENQRITLHWLKLYWFSPFRHHWRFRYFHFNHKISNTWNKIWHFELYIFCQPYNLRWLLQICSHLSAKCSPYLVFHTTHLHTSCSYTVHFKLHSTVTFQASLY